MKNRDYNVTEIDTEEEDIEYILFEARTVAMVGASSDESRPSHQVFKYLKEQGYDVIPVNPELDELMGKRAYPDLASIPEDKHPIDVVDVFRDPDVAPEIVEEAIGVGARNIWFQKGIVNKKASRMAQDAGLGVVMDRCMKKEHMARRA